MCVWFLFIMSALYSRLDNCGLTMRCCRALASTVGSSSSNVRVLDLCNNSIEDKGLELLTAGLENTQCNLEELR